MVLGGFGCVSDAVDDGRFSLKVCKMERKEERCTMPLST